ncbi:MAG: YhjD/YihY/BrkB family envelope integrity protein [Burkholderiales bacterium]
MTSIAFAFLYRTVPNRQVTLLDAAVGGVIAAMAFEGMKNVFGNFIANFANYKLIYGTFASLPILLIWIYLSWVVLVFAAVITAVLPYWRTGGVQLNRAVGNQFVDAVEILRLLYRAYLDGNVLNLQQMRVALRLSWEETELILDKLEAAGWVAKLQGNGWTLVRDVERIRMKEIFRVFVLSKDAAENSQENTVNRLVARVMQGVDGELDMTLKELFGTSIARPARAA